MSLARAEADLVSARNDVKRYENLLENARQRVLKIEHYIEMARLYSGGSDDEENVYSRRQRSGVSGSAVTEVIAHLRDVGRAVKTRDLVPILKAKDIRVSALQDREVTVLSGYLSRAPELVGNRTEGWWLAEWGGPVRPAGPSGTREVGWPQDGAAEAGTDDEPTRAFTSRDPDTNPSKDADNRGGWDKPAPREAPTRGGGGWGNPKSADLDDDIPF